MTYILNIETSTTNCSVCLINDQDLIVQKELNEGYSHSELLTLFIEDVIESSGVTLGELDCVAISKGPGSYTGLRIGTSTAKGLCFALDIPLVSIGTLESMAHGIKNMITEGRLENSHSLLEIGQDLILCPMLDARRMEVYASLYSYNGECIKHVHAEILNENSYEEFFNGKSILFFGDGATKCEELFKENKNALFLNETIYPSAGFMKYLAYDAFINKRYEDVAYFEPFYLKDFVATTPKKLL